LHREFSEILDGRDCAVLLDVMIDAFGLFAIEKLATPSIAGTPPELWRRADAERRRLADAVLPRWMSRPAFPALPLSHPRRGLPQYWAQWREAARREWRAWRGVTLGQLVFALDEDFPEPGLLELPSDLGWSSIKTVALAVVRRNGAQLEHVAPELRADRDVVLASVSNFGDSLKWASETLRDDDEVVQRAIWSWSPSLEHSSMRLRDEASMCLRAVERFSPAWAFASDRLRRDRGFALSSVRANAMVLEEFRFHGEDLNFASDPQIVCEAVKQVGALLEYADDELKDDAGTVLLAVRSDARALQFASDALRDDPITVLAAVRVSPEAISCASLRLRNDLTIGLEAVRRCGTALQFLGREARASFRVSLAAVTQNGLALEHCFLPARDCEAIVIAAVNQNGLSIRHASGRLRKSVEVAKIAAIRDPLSLLHARTPMSVDAVIVEEVEARVGPRRREELRMAMVLKWPQLFDDMSGDYLPRDVSELWLSTLTARSTRPSVGDPEAVNLD
jgi:hypothetical protein